MTAFGLHGSLLATAVITVILLLTLVDSSALGTFQTTPLAIAATQRTEGLRSMDN
jgi:hypothetical protein